MASPGEAGPGAIHRGAIECFPGSPCVANSGSEVAGERMGGTVDYGSRASPEKLAGYWPAGTEVERVALASIQVNSAWQQRLAEKLGDLPRCWDTCLRWGLQVGTGILGSRIVQRVGSRLRVR